MSSLRRSTRAAAATSASPPPPLESTSPSKTKRKRADGGAAASAAVASTSSLAVPSAKGAKRAASARSNGDAVTAAALEAAPSAASDAPHSGARDDDELRLTETERQQLQLVLSSFAPALFDATRFGAPGKAKELDAGVSFASLAEALKTAGTGLRQLRAHVVALRTSTLQGSAAEPSAQLSALTVLLTLVDTLAPKRRASSGTAVKAEAAGSTGVKVEDDVQKDDASEMKPPQKYALHMLLPGGDYFTSATEADPQEIESGVADLVAVKPAPRGEPVPTLGSRVFRADKSHAAAPLPTTERAKPAMHLYYHAWASFAPSYDTTHSTLGLGASRLLWTDGRNARDALRARAWGDVAPSAAAPSAVRSRAGKEVPPAPPAPLDAAEDSRLDRAAFADLHPDLDADGLLRAYEDLEREEEVSVQLARNAQLLARLQEAQAARLRKSFGAKDAAAGDVPDQAEAELARTILDGLAKLVHLRPRDDAQASVVPSAASLRAASRSVAIDPAFLDGDAAAAPGYWGTLDETRCGPEARVRRLYVQRAAASGLTHLPEPLPLAALADNETARMPEQGQTHAAAQAASRLPIGSAAAEAADSKSKKPAGLLERLASSRTYSADGPDPHNPAAPPPNAAGAQSPPLPVHSSPERSSMSIPPTPQHAPRPVGATSSPYPQQQQQYASAQPMQQAQTPRPAGQAFQGGARYPQQQQGTPQWNGAPPQQQQQQQGAMGYNAMPPYATPARTPQMQQPHSQTWATPLSAGPTMAGQMPQRMPQQQQQSFGQ